MLILETHNMDNNHIDGDAAMDSSDVGGDELTINPSTTSSSNTKEASPTSPPSSPSCSTPPPTLSSQSSDSTSQDQQHLLLWKNFGDLILDFGNLIKVWMVENEGGVLGDHAVKGFFPFMSEEFRRRIQRDCEVGVLLEWRYSCNNTLKR